MSARISSRFYPESPGGMIRKPPYPLRDRRWIPISGKRSSSSNANNTDNAWFVNFDNGNVNNNDKNNANNARCVRPGT